MAFADNIEVLKGACGKSLASFPQGGFCYNIFILIFSAKKNIRFSKLKKSFTFVSANAKKKKKSDNGIIGILQDVFSPHKLEN